MKLCIGKYNKYYKSVFAVIPAIDESRLRGGIFTKAVYLHVTDKIMCTMASQ